MHDDQAWVLKEEQRKFYIRKGEIGHLRAEAAIILKKTLSMSAAWSGNKKALSATKKAKNKRPRGLDDLLELKT